MPGRVSRLQRIIPRGLHGIGWVAAATWMVQAIRLATLAVLANFLLPSTFGFFAFSLAIYTVAQPVAGLGLSGALVVKPRLERSDASASLLLAVVAAAIGIIAIGSGIALMRWLNPQLGELLSLTLMLPGLLFANIANVALAIPRRRKEFRKLAIAMIAGEAIGSAVGIALAIVGYGLDALVARYVISAAVMAAIGVFHIRNDFGRPRTTAARELLGFGLPVAGSETLTSLRNRGDELLIGLLFGAATLGIYSIAKRYVDAMRAALPAVIGDHAWPVLASLRDDTREFARQLGRSLQLVGGLVWPTFVAMAVLAGIWVPWLLGNEWSLAIPVAQVLCAIAILQSLVAIPILAIVGLGHTGARFKTDIALTIAIMAAILVGSFGGMNGLLLALFVATVLVMPYQLAVVQRHLPLPFRRILPELVRPMLVNIALALVLIALVSFAVSTLPAIAMFGLAAIMVALAAFVVLVHGRLHRIAGDNAVEESKTALQQDNNLP